MVIHRAHRGLGLLDVLLGPAAGCLSFEPHRVGIAGDTVRRWLRDWQRLGVTTTSVIVDGTMVFGDRLQIFRVSLAHGNRAIPLGWIVVPGKGLIKAERLQTLFARVATLLKPFADQVICLADRGFRDHDWAQFLTQHHAFATHVSMTWTRGEDTAAPELVIVISNQRAHPHRLREYAVRMDIERSFRDDKSGGFDIDHTQLLLAVAIATLWCHELGGFVLQHGGTHRCMIDPAHTRQLSLFQLGLRWLKRCLAVRLDALPVFHAHLSPCHLPPVRLLNSVR